MARTQTLVAAVALLATGCGPEQAADNAARQETPTNAAISADNAGDVIANEAAESKSILRPDVAPTAPPPPTIEPVHGVIAFGASGMKLDEAGRAAIDALLEKAVAKAGGAIILRGSTDSRGNDRDNLTASRLRAEVVRDYMVARGIAGDRITVIALGETRPIAPNAKLDGSDDPEGRAKNRRVDVEIDLPLPPKSEAAPSDANSNG
ncbi:MAG: OmpA family protein [Candidatus Sphingomonas colombiensis]|nr:OmpA family protein [Sphingomonas sp.]WEK42013.1 MAG: OmpA family protein [Sphingomonas sp.]